jgi:hypothetical protein
LHAVRGFIFYKTNNFTTKPPEVDNPTWDLDDGGAWIDENPFPIFAIPGHDGHALVKRLSLYSGSIEQAPHGQEILDVYGPNQRDYIRVWAELTLKDTKSLPALWTFFVIVLGSLLVIVTSVSIFLHVVQRRRRKNLSERVKAGELDLEREGICRVQVPEPLVKSFPIYTYWDPEKNSEPTTPAATSAGGSGSVPPGRTSGPGDRSIMSIITTTLAARTRTNSEMSTIPTNNQPCCLLCERMFEPMQSVIRELPCKHIFHPECIDEYLMKNSSLCPKCRKSMLRKGYVPRITNAMVRRERALRRVKGKVELEPTEDGKHIIRIFSRRRFLEKESVLPIALPRPAKMKLSPEETPLPPSAPSSPAPTTTPPPRPAPIAGGDTVVATNASSSASIPQTEEITALVADTAAKPRQSRPKTKKSRRGRRVHPQEDKSVLDHQPDGRIVHTEEMLARMRHLAEEFVEPDAEALDKKRPICKLFPSSSILKT